MKKKGAFKAFTIIELLVVLAVIGVFTAIAYPNIMSWITDREVKKEVYETVTKIWKEKVMTSQALQDYASERGAVFAPRYGQDAMDRAMPVVISEACARVTRGEAVLDPSEIGITCPVQ